MRVILIFLASFISGCVGTQNINTTSMPLGYGAWYGELEQITTKPLPDGSETAEYKVLVLFCDSEPEFWLKAGEANYLRIYSDYSTSSKSGSTLFHKIIEGQDWVETQTWIIVDINEERAAIQWSRMVSNPTLEPSEELRSFGQVGYSELVKVNSSCDIWS